MTKRITALALTACLVLAGAAQKPPTAVAAPYTVKQCSSATNYTNFFFQSRINGNIRNGGTQCQAYALYTIANANVTYSYGTWGGFTAYAPGGLNIVGFSAHLWGLWNNFGTTISGTPMRIVGEAGSARFADDLGTIFNWSYPTLVSWGGAGGPATSMFIGFKCLNGAGCNHRGVDKRVRFRDVTFTMNDPSAPTVTGVGGSLTTPGWKHGNQTLSLSANDSGGGISAIIPAVDQGTNPPALAGDCPRAGG